MGNLNRHTEPRPQATSPSQLVTVLARDTNLWTDDVWVIDSTPGRMRPLPGDHAPNLAGSAEYGYCASHSRYFWYLRLHLVSTLHGFPIGLALTGRSWPDGGRANRNRARGRA